jgi:hypothetical protein
MNFGFFLKSDDPKSNPIQNKTSQKRTRTGPTRNNPKSETTRYQMA